MKRIVIFGNSGSGKSTFAHHLSEKHKIPHLDLDTLAWLPTEPPTRQPLKIAQQTVNTFIQQNTDWVIEGCYGDLIEHLFPSCNEIYFLNLPIDLCIENAKQRPWEPHKYESQALQDQNLPMLLEWIKQYTTRQDTFSLQFHKQLFDKFRGTKHKFVSQINF
ncbi:hypothetical protein NBRC116188_11460 [Oceaniserpentilla sp. 4NH20-0058]|uniref:AAA family ATPase n=1 Tax=Oceaniserpentilla sp. 4NH20-0058 TaxID=3127660 RepID=UPI003102A753